MTREAMINERIAKIRRLEEQIITGNYIKLNDKRRLIIDRLNREIRTLKGE